MRTMILAFSLLASVGACQTRSTRYCGLHPDDTACTVDATPLQGCDNDAACASLPATPRCDTQAQTCVACLEPGDAANDACTAATPICESQACRACRNHDECDSGLCLVSGQCAATEDVAYVAPTGTVNAVCNRSTPCTMAAGLARGLALLRVAGTNIGTHRLSNQTIAIYGYGPHPTLESTTENQPTLTIENGNVALYGVTITGNHIGIEVPASAPDTQLTINRVIIGDNNSTGLLMAAGTLTLTNSYVIRNGNNAAGISALFLGDAVDARSRIAHITVADNASLTGPVAKCGSNLKFEASLFARNKMNGTASLNMVTGLLLSSTEITDAPFVNTGGNRLSDVDYHLTAANNEVTQSANVPLDFDGHARGARPHDAGADEVP